MGGGTWTTRGFAKYTVESKKLDVDATTGTILTSFSFSDQGVYESRRLDPSLDPYEVVRECRDTEEHPNTKPVIIGLDVTGSMSDVLIEVAKSIGEIMSKIIDMSETDPNIKDIEFCIMAYGDLAYDDAPIQISQFESDVRIAEHLDKVFFEKGGGGNCYESTTAIWYMGSRHCDLDCWKRGEKGLIITVGDEKCPPYLPEDPLSAATGDSLQEDIETEAIFEEAKEKFDIYHINISHRNGVPIDNWANAIESSFVKYIGEGNYFDVNVNSLPNTITDIIVNKYATDSKKDASGLISW